MRRFLLFKILCLSTLFLIPPTAHAWNYRSGDMYYTIVDGKAYLDKGEKAYSGGLLIPHRFEDSNNRMVYVYGIMPGALEGSSIERITIETSVDDYTIPEGTFKGQTKLTEIRINSTLTVVPSTNITIGDNAFSECSAVTTACLYGNITLGNNVFANCSQLKTFIMNRCSDGTVISNQFTGCTALNSITIRGNLTLSTGAFADCTSISTLSLTDANVRIEAGAFGSLVTITYAYLTNCAITGNGFQGTAGPRSLYLYGATTLGESVFEGCTGLKYIYFKQEGGNTMGKRCFANCTALSSVSLTCSGDLSIGEEAFAGCTALTDCTRTGDITIGANAYNGCTAIKSVNLTSGKAEVAEGAFTGCTKLTTVSVDSVQLVGVGGFRGVSSLTTLTIKDNSTIGEGAFADCAALNKITLYDGTPVIPATAFSGCTASTTLYLKDVSTEQASFDGLTNLTHVEISGASTIAANAFKDHTELTSLSMSGNLTLGERAFTGCTGLTSLSFSTSRYSSPELKQVGDYAFSGCTGVKNISATGPMTIGAYAFDGCTAVTKATLSSGDFSIGTNAFASPKSFMLILNDITSLNENAFANSTGLTSLTVSGSTLGERTFANFAPLTQLTIKDASNLGTSAFAGCTGLTSLTISGAVDLGASAFEGCTNITQVSATGGSGALNVGSRAFAGCTALKSLTLNKYYTANPATVADAAFEGDTALESLTLGGKLVCTGKPFATAKGLKHIIHSGNVSSEDKESFDFPYEAFDTNSYDPATITPVDDVIFNRAMLQIAYGKTLDEYLNSNTNWRYFANIHNYGLTSYMGSFVNSWGDVVRFVSGPPMGVDSKEAFYDINGDGTLNYFRITNGTNSSNSAQPYAMLRATADEPLAINGFLYGYWNNPWIIRADQADRYVINMPGSGNIHTGELTSLSPDENYTTTTGRIIADINGDGTLDLLRTESQEHTIWHGNYDGTRRESRLTTTADTTLVYLEQTGQSRYMTGIPSLRDGWMIKESSAPKAFGNLSSAVDLNNDGILDLIDNTAGGILYSMGGNSYFEATDNFELYPCDLNGDGEQDFVYNNDGVISVMLYQTTDNSYKTMKLYENTGITDVICRDFDNDGDIDILLQFGYDSKTTQYTYLVFMRNEGNNSFKRRESAFGQKVSFLDCLDFNNDGLYEILCYDASTHTYGLINIDSKLNASLSDWSYSGYTTDDLFKTDTNATEKIAYETVIAGDLNNDGHMELFAHDNYFKSGSGITNYPSVIYTFSGRANSAPAKMKAPVVSQDVASNRIKITWEAGSDAESSAADLTYALRIGTKPGANDILNGQANADGMRRTLSEGNMGRTRRCLFNTASLPSGEYYIAVQAIDVNGLGGAWSAETQYSHTAVAPILEATFANASTADTLTLTVTNAVTGATYDWKLDGGKLVGSNGGTASVSFERAGNYTLSASLDGTPSNEVEVSIAPYKTTSYAYGSYSSGYYFDANQNGRFDRISGNYLQANNGDGTFTQVAKSFNSSLSGTLTVFDYDRDGYPDMYLSKCSKGNIFTNLGEGDYDFDYNKVDFTFNLTGSTSSIAITTLPTTICDFLHNGLASGYSSEYLYHARTANDFDVAKRSVSVRNTYLPYDVDRDGFVDLICNTTGEVLINEGDGTATYSEPQQMFDLSGFEFSIIGSAGSTDNIAYADLNNDGLIDVIAKPVGTNTLYVILGVKREQWPAKEVVKIPLYGTETYSLTNGIHTIDFDNNGYVDLRLGTDYLFLMEAGLKGEVKELQSGDYPFVSLSEGSYPEMNLYYAASGHIRNEAPQTPTDLATTQTAKGLLITWSDAEDDFTPAAQMRYNVSVKRKGANGTGSYLISPMNGMEDRAGIVPNVHYTKATRFLVPSSVITTGETYEVSVQAIDLWNEHSAMAAPVSITVGAAGTISVPERVGVDDKVTVKFEGTAATSLEWSFGDNATIISKPDATSIIVSWSKAGVQQIGCTVDGTAVKGSTTVVDHADLTADIPTTLFGGADYTCTLPMAMRDARYERSVEASSEELKVNFSSTDSLLTLNASKTGYYTLTFKVNDGLVGTEKSYPISVSEMMPTPTITSISAEADNYRIGWSKQSLPNGISKAVILREGETTDVFQTIGTTDASAQSYLDHSSSARMKAERYTVRYVADNGQVSKDATPHTGLHIMLNTTSSGGFNIIWNGYEGRDVVSYRILRGTSADNLTTLTTVSGSNRNYTDLTGKSSDEYFYSVVPVYATAQAKVATRNTDGANEGQSNVLSTRYAVDAVYGSSMNIFVLESSNEINATIKNLHLYAAIFPLSTTFTTVKWEVISGAELAEVDANGVVTPTGKGVGDITIKASAIDGSDLSATITITIADINGSGINSVLADAPTSIKLNAIFNRSSSTLRINGWGENQGKVTIHVISMSGMLIAMTTTEAAESIIGTSNFTPGIYIVRAIGQSFNASKKVLIQ